MGLRLSRQRYVHSNYAGNQGPLRVDYSAYNVTESQYGSWTKLSITDLVNIDDTTPPPSSNSSTDMTLQHAQREEVTCTQLLTQPPSREHDSVIGEVAEKLIDVDADVMRRKESRFSTSYDCTSKRGKSSESHKPQHNKLALHYSLNMHLETYSEEEAEMRRIIDQSLFDHFETLVKQVEPEEVAQKLYGIAVLDGNEVEYAEDSEEPVQERARALLQLIKKKLWSKPQWFVEICKVLRTCGVKGISDVIDDVQKQCPTLEMSIKSNGSVSEPSTVKVSPQRQSVYYHNTLTELEKSFKENGVQEAKEYVQRITTEKPDISLLHEACLSDVDIATLDFLLTLASEENHNINSKDKCGQTPLHVACASLRSPAESCALGNVEQRLKIEHLLTQGAKNSIKDKDGNTPLHLAVLRMDCESVALLLKHGKRCLNSTNKRGNTALHLACRLGSVDIVKTLCSYKANTSIQNMKMRTALHLACIYEHTAAAVELASHDPSTLDGFDKYRMTPLHISCKKSTSTLALSLLKLKNCHPNKADQDEKTPLHYACSSGNLDLVVGLLERESSKTFVDAQDKFGDTALHIASRSGCKEIVNELISRRVSRDIQNQEGKNPLEVAIEYDHGTIASKMLRKRGWNQRRKSLQRVRKLRRTLTHTSLISSANHSENSGSLDYLSDESGDDETMGRGWTPSSPS